jgi:alkanesulfonate monooxygenase SsuD/methylene tetrahydromethanopterin reductase-like flavin-dependent oxidoreductase (luciferase family)
VFRLRFDMRAPGRSADEVARLYEAALEMSAWADGRGCQAIAVSEHHASDDGYLPSPLVMAAAIAAVTTQTPIMVAAALLPLYDPVRLAEEMIVLDHLSRGRVIHVLGIGYRPVEYELHGVDYRRRGRLADEKLEALLGHLRAADAGSAPTRVTPAPFSPGGPMLVWGGSTPRAAARAGRHGLGFIAQSGDPALGQAYEEAARSAGHAPGLCVLPDPASPASVFVATDVDQAWREVGDALLADASAYYAWNAAAGLADRTVSLTKGSTVDELRAANGSHRVVTVDEAVALIRRDGALGLQPLCGGLDPDVAWPYLRRVVEEVLPAMGDA